jgi:hypothetical protein
MEAGADSDRPGPRRIDAQSIIDIAQEPIENTAEYTSVVSEWFNLLN